jgi:TonB-linked SusC/RagA family outer membrane protein
MKLLLYTFLLITLTQETLYAQHAGLVTGIGIILRGKVVDKEKKPVHGVNVTEVDAEKRIIHGTTTDVEGNFALHISSVRNLLSFTVVGYKPATEKIGEKVFFNVTLEQGSVEMNEAIVVNTRRVDNGLVSIPEKDLTIASSHINAKVMEEMQATSIDQALQGRIAGVDITAASGDPGAGMQIRIRGTTSINASSNPLVVVDGIPYNTTIPSDFNFGTADDQGYADLINIAPSDIKDITVLKDAAATAMWGSRAANGVILITTKRGNVGKPVVTYTFKGTVSKQPSSIPMLNGDQYSTLIAEEYMNGNNGRPLNTQTQAPALAYDPSDPYNYYNFGQNTDWVKAITQLGWINNHNIAMSGGGEKARYFASLDYLRQTGTTIGTDLTRTTTRINLDYNVSDRIRFRSDLAYSNTNNNRSYVQSTSNNNPPVDNIRNIAYAKMPDMSIYAYDQYGNLTPNYFSPATTLQGQYVAGSSSSTYNPVAMALYGRNNIVSRRVTPHFNLQYDVIPAVLQLTSDVQFDINATRNKQFLPQIATGLASTDPNVNKTYDGDVDQFDVQSKTTLVYTPNMKNQKNSFVAFMSLQTDDNKSIEQQAATSNTASSLLQDPSIPSSNTSAQAALSSGTSETRTIGAVVDAQYNLLDRYILNLGLRGDGNSRFGPGHRYGLFPSASGRWRLSAEPFMQKLPFAKKINDLSLRFSYGQSGNAPKTDYSFYNTYNTYQYSYAGQAGVYPGQIGLDNLRWETVVGKNLGLNIILFNRKVDLDVEFYKDRTLNLFFPNLAIPGYNGFSAVNLNVGTMDNQGFEINLNLSPVRTKYWAVDFNLNLAKNENVIRSISPYFPTSTGNTTGNGAYKSYLQINNPLGSIYGFKYLGVYKDQAATIAKDAKGAPILSPTGQPVQMTYNYPSVNEPFQPGDAIYADINHDGNISYLDQVYLGNSTPKLTGGFGPTITYKGRWKLSAFFNFRYGYDVENSTKMTTTNMFGYNNQSTAVLRRWRKPGDVTDIPRALYQAGFNWMGSSRYVEDASFLRFRALTLRYTIPSSELNKLKIRNLSAYLTAENLITWTKYTGQDPEVPLPGGNPFAVATDVSVTPPVKMLTLGLTASF